MRVSPEVSVIIPVYNSMPYLPDTLNSLMAQSFSDWEALCIVDAKSGDTSIQFLDKIARTDPRILVLHGPAEGGVAANRNHGVVNARGRYLAFLDSDDLWRPQKLETQLRRMRESPSAFSYHSTQFLSEDGLRHGRAFVVPPKIDRKQLLRTNYIGCSTVILDREALHTPIHFDQKFHEDLRLWLKILSEIPFAEGNPEILSDYRVRESQLSAHKGNAARHRWQIICESEKSGLMRALAFFLYAWRGWRKHRRVF